MVDDSAGIGSGNALQMVPTSDFYRMLAFFPSTTPASAGDTLKVTFDFHFTVVPDNLGGGFRIGLCNSAGTKQTAGGSPATNTGQSRNEDKNYGFDTNAGAASSTGTGVRYEDAGSAPDERLLFMAAKMWVKIRLRQRTNIWAAISPWRDRPSSFAATFLPRKQSRPATLMSQDDRAITLPRTKAATSCDTPLPCFGRNAGRP